MRSRGGGRPDPEAAVPGVVCVGGDKAAAVRAATRTEDDAPQRSAAAAAVDDAAAAAAALELRDRGAGKDVRRPVKSSDPVLFLQPMHGMSKGCAPAGAPPEACSLSDRRAATRGWGRQGRGKRRGGGCRRQGWWCESALHLRGFMAIACSEQLTPVRDVRRPGRRSSQRSKRTCDTVNVACVCMGVQGCSPLTRHPLHAPTPCMHGACAVGMLVCVRTCVQHVHVSSEVPMVFLFLVLWPETQLQLASLALLLLLMHACMLMLRPPSIGDAFRLAVWPGIHTMLAAVCRTRVAECDSHTVTVTVSITLCSCCCCWAHARSENEA
eukprot:365449-Chlamydomonas_euryale.AAC.6